MSVSIAVDEAVRLEALRSFDVLDMPTLPVFEQVVQVASFSAGTPIALVSLVDSDRLYFMARAGLDVQQVPSEGSLCNYAVRTSQDMLEVRDASEDARFADSALVTGFPGIRFYAGVPLISGEGHALGTLCVIDRTPRVLTDSQRMALFCLAHVTVELLESRRRERRLEARLVADERQSAR